MENKPERILIIYSWPELWSMGQGKGSPDFFLSLKALAENLGKVVVAHPDRPGSMEGAPDGLELRPFAWPGGGWLIRYPSWVRKKKYRWVGFLLKGMVFSANLLLRIFYYFSFSLAAYRTARQAADSMAPDLVAAYGSRAALAACLVSRSCGVPLVVRLFGVSLGMRGFSFPARVAQFEEYLAFRIKADRWVITDDGSGGDLAARALGVPDNKVRLLVCGVERTPPENCLSRDLYRKTLGLPSEARVLLRVSRLWSQQRIDRMIRQLPDKDSVGRPVAAVVAGEGPEEEYLGKLAGQLGARVLFLGAVDHQALAQHYLAADLYVATGDRTNLSNSVLEALCHGLPVVALDTGYTAKMIVDGVNGVLVPFDQRNRLQEIVLGLLDNDTLRSRLAEGALRTADKFIPDYRERMKMELEAFSVINKSGEISPEGRN